MVRATILAVVLASLASASEPDWGRPENTYVKDGCTPAYWTMDSEDVMRQWWINVRILHAGGTEMRTYTFSNRPCCQIVRETLVDFVKHLTLDEQSKIKVDICM